MNGIFLVVVVLIVISTAQENHGLQGKIPQRQRRYVPHLNPMFNENDLTNPQQNGDFFNKDGKLLDFNLVETC